jgi:hypothetical protein
MEYINFNNHLLRIICSQFQIDPVELGLDYLVSASGRAPMQQANNEYKIEYSRERGLYPILMFIEDMVNSDILPALDKELALRYKFIFTGYTDESPQTEIAQMQAEMTVFKTMNDLLVQAQKKKIKEPAADLPLNQSFWALVEKNYTRGEIREKFFGDKGASTRKELQYIPGDQAYLAWAQLLSAFEQQKMQRKDAKEQQAQQAQIQQLELQRDEELHNHAKEKHQMEMERAHAEAAANAVKARSLKDSAKEFGATKAINVGGKILANPINHLVDEE